MKNFILTYYPFVPLLLLCGFFAYKAIDFPIHDFANYYFGGHFLAENQFTSAIYFPYEFNKSIADLGHHNIFVSYAPNTPFLAFFFVPFSWLAVGIAKLVFNCISIGLFICSISRLFSHYKINPLFALLIPLMFLVPIKNNLLFGQVYFLLFFLLAEGWLAYEKEHWKSMALFWGLAILLKVFPVLLLVFLIFKKKWNAIFYTVVFCGLLTGISLFFTGIDVWVFYLKDVLPKASNGEIANSFVDNYQSVFMFLKRCFVYEAAENPEPLLQASNYFPIAVLAFKAMLLSIGFFISKKRFTVFYAFSFWLLAMVLLSPYGSTYSLILLVFPFLTLAGSDISNLKKVLFLTILFLVCNLPLSLFMEQPFPVSYLRLFLLLVLFALFLAQSQQKINWKIVAVIGLLPLILVLFPKKETAIKSSILLDHAPILLYDYEINNDGLHAHFWTEQGEGLALMPMKHQSIQPLKLKENQVFYKNQQLTFDKSNKLKPVLIDHKTILYLSDYDRGIGFYTIRKIELK